jgi:hypothetical protein
MPIVLRILTATMLGALVAAPLAAKDDAPGFDPAVARRISPAEVVQRRVRGEKPIVLDVRGRVGDTVVQGAVRVPSDRLEAWARDVPRDAFVVAYCS